MSKPSKSPWVIHYDASSCNGCDIEVLSALTPGFDLERFGVINTGDPKHADVFLVTGGVNTQNISVIQQIYDQMLEPKVVIACGACACSGGVFHSCYNLIGGVDKAIPVDVYVPGCAVHPTQLIDGFIKGLEILDKKAALMSSKKKNKQISQSSGVQAIPSPEAAEHKENSLNQETPVQKEATKRGA